jgi:ATP-binding cassette subfamily C protein LapB
MHWLDAQPSREIDPVLDCLTYLARTSDRPSSPVLLRAGLAVSEQGTLPATARRFSSKCAMATG